jgi:hypothetical protein
MNVAIRRGSTFDNDGTGGLGGGGGCGVLLSGVIDKGGLGGGGGWGRGGTPKRLWKDVGGSPYGTDFGGMKDGVWLDGGRIRSAKSCNPGGNERA